MFSQDVVQGAVGPRYHPYGAVGRLASPVAGAAAHPVAGAQPLFGSRLSPQLEARPFNVVRPLNGPPPAGPTMNPDLVNMLLRHQEMCRMRLQALAGYHFQPPLSPPVDQQPAVPPQPVGRQLEQLPAGAVWQQAPFVQFQHPRDMPQMRREVALPELPRLPPRPANLPQPDVNHNFNIVDVELLNHARRRCSICGNLPANCSCDAPLDLSMPGPSPPDSSPDAT